MRKKDEMEQKLANKAIKVVWFITVMTLFIIGGYRYYIDGVGMNIFLIIAGMSVVSVRFLEHYYLSKANGDNKFRKLVTAALILIIVFLGISWVVS